MSPLSRIVEFRNMRDYRVTDRFTARWFAMGSYADGKDPYEGFDAEPVSIKVGDLLRTNPDACKGHEFEGQPFVLFFIQHRIEDADLDDVRHGTFSVPPQVFTDNTKLVDQPTPPIGTTD